MRLNAVRATAIGLPIVILALPILAALVDRRVNVYDPTTSILRDSGRAAYEQYRTLRLRDEIAALASGERVAMGLALRAPDTAAARHEAAAALRGRLAELSQAPGLMPPALPLVVVLRPEPPRDASETARPVEGVALPRRAGAPCVVQTSTERWPLGAASAGIVTESRRLWVESGVINTPCLLLAAFGRPAPRLAASLDSIQWVVAYGDEWWRPARQDSAWRLPNRRNGVESFLGEELVELEFLALFDDCVTAPPRGCGAALVGALSELQRRHRQPLVTDDAVLLPPARLYSAALVAPIVGADGRLVARVGGRRVRHLMSDIARTLGPERFARMWRTDLPWPEAYAAVAGEPFDAFAARWLHVSAPRPIVRAAGVPSADWWWLAAIVATLLGATLWKVQRRQHA